eukprot:TRINITY_DN5973_c0_g1_i8.p1 TRINITY_DN5973_c0_g1~~TRINITY_DN5973_c0_g1_i8.p1  ORF type:complete len:796 (+),score=155.08 TRINITY_DN5973_c0_g1_i8:30-2417(+)
MKTLLIQEKKGISRWSQYYDYAITLGGRLATAGEVIQWLDGRPYISSELDLWVPILVNLVDIEADWVQITSSNYGRTYKDLHGGLPQWSETDEWIHNRGPVLVTFTSDVPGQIGDSFNPCRPGSVIVIEPSSASSSEEREPEPEPYPEPSLSISDPPAKDSGEVISIFSTIDSSDLQKKITTTSFTETEETDEDVITIVVTTTTVMNPQNRTKTITTKKDKTIMNKTTGKIAVLEDDECPIIIQSFSTSDDEESSKDHSNEGEGHLRSRSVTGSSSNEVDKTTMKEIKSSVRKSPFTSKTILTSEEPELVEGPGRGQNLVGRSISSSSGSSGKRKTEAEGLSELGGKTPIIKSSSSNSSNKLTESSSSLTGQKLIPSPTEEKEEETRPGPVPLPERIKPPVETIFQPERQESLKTFKKDPKQPSRVIVRGASVESRSTEDKNSKLVGNFQTTTQNNSSALSVQAGIKSTGESRSHTVFKKTDIIHSGIAKSTLGHTSGSSTRNPPERTKAMQTDKYKKVQFQDEKVIGQGIQAENTRSRAMTINTKPFSIPPETRKVTEKLPAARKRSVSTATSSSQSSSNSITKGKMRATTTVTEESWEVVAVQGKPVPPIHSSVPEKNVSKVSTSGKQTIVDEEFQEWSVPSETSSKGSLPRESGCDVLESESQEGVTTKEKGTLIDPLRGYREAKVLPVEQSVTVQLISEESQDERNRKQNSKTEITVSQEEEWFLKEQNRGNMSEDEKSEPCRDKNNFPQKNIKKGKQWYQRRVLFFFFFFFFFFWFWFCFCFWFLYLYCF